MKKKDTIGHGSCSSYRVPALERGMKILEMISRYPRGISMTDIRQASNMPSASLYRMLVTLAELGYVIREPDDRYRLSRKILSLGHRAIDEALLTENAVGPMRELRDLTGETVMLGTLYGGEGIVVECVKSNQAVCVSIRIGHHYPLHTAAPAKAMIAFLPEEEKESLIRGIHYTVFTEKTVRTADEFRKELDQVRKNGIAYDLGEELRELRCAGAPILNEHGYPVAAVWLGGPESRLDGQILFQQGAFVKETALKIQRFMFQE